MIGLTVCLIVAVTDGDTLKARCGLPESYEQVTIRLAEIDAPEKAQEFGRASKEELAKHCVGMSATVRPEKLDRYGRTVARVTCGREDASLHQVRTGMAWGFTRYLTDPTIKATEEQARAQGIGLWSGQPPQPPWEWRALRR